MNWPTTLRAVHGSSAPVEDWKGEGTGVIVSGSGSQAAPFGTVTPVPVVLGAKAGKTFVYALSHAASIHGCRHASDHRIFETVQIATNRRATAGVVSRNTKTLTPRMRSSITAAINRRG